MTRVARVLAWLGAAFGAVVLLTASSMLLALAAVGVFATAGDAWTVEVSVLGAPVRANVIGLVRLVTLPGVVHWLDGRAIRTGSGELRFTRDGTALRATCAPCRVRHPDLASAPVQIRAVAVEVAREEDVARGTLVVDTVRLPFTAHLRAASVDIEWQLPPTELAAVYRALADAVPEAAFARIEGTVHAEGTLSLPSRRARARWSAEALEVGGLGTEPLQYGAFRVACARADGSRRLVTTGDGEKPWTAVDAMGTYLAASVVAAEDQRFHLHAGYDVQAMTEILADLADGRPKRGGSTLTQQLARTLFTGGDRTAARKLRELLYAVEMERTLGKARILELYLNTVDWGPGLCGAKAAARAYFNKSPAQLTALEAAWLAASLRNPHAAWEQFVERRPERERATQVLMQMRGWPKRERQKFAAQPLAFAAARRPPGGAAWR